MDHTSGFFLFCFVFVFYKKTACDFYSLATSGYATVGLKSHRCFLFGFYLVVLQLAVWLIVINAPLLPPVRRL